MTTPLWQLPATTLQVGDRFAQRWRRNARQFRHAMSHLEREPVRDHHPARREPECLSVTADRARPPPAPRY